MRKDTRGVIAAEDEAVQHRLCGSPTVLIDGVDLEGPSARQEGSYLRCRIYARHGECPGVPHRGLIRSALYCHPGKRHPGERPRAQP